MPVRDSAPPGAPCRIDLCTSDPTASTVFYAAVAGGTRNDGAAV